MPEHCPRCGYPDPGPRVPTAFSEGGGFAICLPCYEVEHVEYQQLGYVLPLEKWAVND